MWCEQCQTDVATAVSEDGQSLLCTTCGQPARQVVAPSLHPETKSAREFLERWAREQQALKQQRESQTSSELPATPAISAESPSPLPVTLPPAAAPIRPATGNSSSTGTPPESDSSSRPRWRLDSEHPAPVGPQPGRTNHPRRSQRLEKVLGETASETSGPAQAPAPQPAEAPAPRPVKRQTRVDAGQSAAAAGPHFDPRVNSRRVAMPGRSESLWGQLMAYLGVGLLTVGTVFVLWGYFGDIESYASTGWLIATAGQMLLLLGIVTLVGGGMQQTTHEVSQRIEHLGGRIIRIEQSTEQILRGPHRRRSRQSNAHRANRQQDAA